MKNEKRHKSSGIQICIQKIKENVRYRLVIPIKREI